MLRRRSGSSNSQRPIASKPAAAYAATSSANEAFSVEIVESDSFTSVLEVLQGGGAEAAASSAPSRRGSPTPRRAPAPGGCSRRRATGPRRSSGAPAPRRTAARRGSGRARSSPRRCRRRRGCSSASRGRRVRGPCARASRSRGSRSSRRAARRSGRRMPPAARRSRFRRRTSISPAASPRTGPAGSSWSWIQTIHLPSGARDGSTAHGWPATIVASAGRRPRSASFTARETPSSPGVTWTIAVRASRSASGPFQRGGSSSARWICMPARP